MFPTLALIYFIICGIMILIHWYKMLAILKSKGKRDNYFLLGLGSYIDFSEIISKETNPQLIKRYRKILWTQIALVPAYIIGMIIIFALT
jgi:hypothetical protein